MQVTNCTWTKIDPVCCKPWIVYICGRHFPRAATRTSAIVGGNLIIAAQHDEPTYSSPVATVCADLTMPKPFAILEKLSKFCFRRGYRLPAVRYVHCIPAVKMEGILQSPPTLRDDDFSSIFFMFANLNNQSPTLYGRAGL
jgi:hypothetical protein